MSLMTGLAPGAALLLRDQRWSRIRQATASLSLVTRSTPADPLAVLALTTASLQLRPSPALDENAAQDEPEHYG